MNHDYEEFAYCGYIRLGTSGQWFPLERDAIIEKLQKRIEELEKRTYIENATAQMLCKSEATIHTMKLMGIIKNED